MRSDPMDSAALNQKEVRLLQLLADGNSYAQVAPLIGYKNAHSVKNLSKLAIEKLGADNKTQAVAMALRRGIIQ